MKRKIKAKKTKEDIIVDFIVSIIYIPFWLAELYIRFWEKIINKICD